MYDFEKLSKVTLEDGSIYSISVQNNSSYGGLALTSENFATSNNSRVKLSSYEKHLSQMWRVRKNADGTYSFENMSSRMCLTIANSADAQTQQTLTVCLAGTADSGKKWIVYSADGKLDSCILINHLSQLAAYVDSDGYAKQIADSDLETPRWSLKKLDNGDREYPYVLALSGDYQGSSSCPEIIYHNGAYYNYNMSGPITVKTSPDLLNWKCIPEKYAFPERFEWLETYSSIRTIWAPGAYKIRDKYYLYYCTSTGGSQNSAIGVAVSCDPSKNDWKDKGLVIRSYTGGDYNCIDPNIFIEDDGTVFLIFGSYWKGIYMRKIDPDTGLLDKKDTKTYHIARGNHDMEAPYMIKHSDYYYLFVARGGLRKGTYYWAVGRSKSVYGPFLDKKGKAMLSGKGGTRLTEWKEGICGVAHAQYFVDKDGQSYMVSESWPYRNGSEHGKIQLHISSIVWTDDGWPVTALSPDVLGDLK